MILLRNTTDPQTVNILANVDREDLPLNGVSFEFTDLYSGNVSSVTSDLTADGISQQATVTVNLREDSKYDLRVFTTDRTEIYKDTVFVTNQNLETYSVNDGDFVFFDTGIANNALVIFEP